MILIVCLDDNNGMMFNRRRQSRDRALVERIKEITAGKRLWMNEYSAKLFGEGVYVDEDFLEKANEGEYCFVENAPLPDEGIENVIVYKWNRDYPADTYFDLDLGGLDPESIYEFEGSSHDNITEEVYNLK